MAAVVFGFKNRFKKFLNLDPKITDTILASVSHPLFKLRWVCPNSDNAGDLEVFNYLKDPNKELDSLNSYKSVREIFIKYNTALTSSAPVERLFSFAGMVNAPKRRRLTDRNFEKLILLKANIFGEIE